jgi:ABC-type uncharacterized transport system permease subunit
MNILRITKTLISILLIVVISLFIITGFGITNYRVIESLTFGFLSKPLSFQVHSNLTIPLIILLFIHITFALYKKLQRQNQS